jgi:hypothetical protein
VFALVVLVLQPSAARAYSSFADYALSIEEGGGGGKFFTGTPGDGYTCDVCHSGAASRSLDVVGLPESGYVPGQSYEIGFRWAGAGEPVPHVALMAELTDMLGTTAGTLALVPYAQWTAEEKCAEDAFPAADVCRAGAAPGCCRDLDPTRDACSFPDERSLFWMLECGARAARMSWTAPLQPVDVWFSASMVSSNAGNDALGDGVTLLRRRLVPQGKSLERTGALGSCQVQSVGSSGACSWLYALFGAAAMSCRRRRHR